VTLDDLVQNECRQVIKQMHVVDTNNHRDARRCGSQRFNHAAHKLETVGDNRLCPSSESTQGKRPHR